MESFALTGYKRSCCKCSFCFPNNVQYIKISNHSKYIASVSENGSIIKIFDLKSLNLIKLLYRGLSHSEIITIEFDKNDDYVLVYSNLNLHT